MASYSVPLDVPDAAEDAEQLWEALHWKLDQLAIIKIIAHRNVDQRTAIRQVYQDKYGHSLLTALRQNITDEFLRSVSLWIFPSCVRDALLIHEAIHYISEGRIKIRRWRKLACNVFVEIFCSRSPNEVVLVKNTYYSYIGKHIEEEVQCHTTNGNSDILNFLLKLVSTHRDIGNEVNKPLAKQEAKVIYDKIEQKHYNDDEIIKFLVTRSMAQISETEFEYIQLSGCGIFDDLYGVDCQDKEDDIHREIRKVLRNAINCLLLPNYYYVEILRKSIVNKDDNSLTRVVVTRAEIDLKEIKDLFWILNDESLEDAIICNIKHYEMLIQLLGHYDTFKTDSDDSSPFQD